MSSSRPSVVNSPSERRTRSKQRRQSQQRLQRARRCRLNQIADRGQRVEQEMGIDLRPQRSKLGFARELCRSPARASRARTVRSSSGWRRYAAPPATAMASSVARSSERNRRPPVSAEIVIAYRGGSVVGTMTTAATGVGEYSAARHEVWRRRSQERECFVARHDNRAERFVLGERAPFTPRNQFGAHRRSEPLAHLDSVLLTRPRAPAPVARCLLATTGSPAVAARRCRRTRR